MRQEDKLVLHEYLRIFLTSFLWC